MNGMRKQTGPEVSWHGQATMDRDDGVRPRALAFKRWRLSSLHSFTSILAGPISRHERVFCWLARVLITDAICPFFLQSLIFWSAVLGSLAPGLPWPWLVALLVSIPSPYYRLSYIYIYKNLALYDCQLYIWTQRILSRCFLNFASINDASIRLE